MLMYKYMLADFLRFLESSKPDDDDRLHALCTWLDKLEEFALHIAVSYDDLDDEVDEPPKLDYAQIRTDLEKRFPDLGCYRLDAPADPGLNIDPVIIGEAMEDLVDIVGDLKNGLWYWWNVSEPEALFHLNITYWSHWGVHLKKLQIYLSHMMAGNDLGGCSDCK